jgi:hypothetical protein
MSFQQLPHDAPLSGRVSGLVTTLPSGLLACVLAGGRQGGLAIWPTLLIWLMLYRRRSFTPPPSQPPLTGCCQAARRQAARRQAARRQAGRPGNARYDFPR